VFDLRIGNGRHKMLRLDPLPNVQRLSSRVIAILGQNPRAYTLQGTNTYLLGSGAKRMLLDTGEGYPLYAEVLADVLRTEGASIARVLLSHHHYDHIGGFDDPAFLALLDDDVEGASWGEEGRRVGEGWWGGGWDGWGTG
jgi:glyoxylase-like metal-dependent hydrolase (beta-lactamase superfamily II)